MCIRDSSERLIVMSQYSSRVLQEVFNVSAGKIDLIPHGIPDIPFEQPDVYKKLFSCQGKSVLLTFGLLSPNKGFESVIRAMPRILSSHSNAVYMIAGATHPQIRAREGDRYRLELQALAKQVGVEEQVLFVNRFVTPEEDVYKRQRQRRCAGHHPERDSGDVRGSIAGSMNPVSYTHLGEAAQRVCPET